MREERQSLTVASVWLAKHAKNAKDAKIQSGVLPGQRHVQAEHDATLPVSTQA